MRTLVRQTALPLFFLAFIIFPNTSLVKAQNLAYPLPGHWHESGGFGTNTLGGLNGTVYKVTNLNNSGTGSFRDAVSGDNRLVVFEVGGVIDLNNSDIALGSNVTIAGQTAPSPGIILIRANFSANGNNTVVSHITIMLGDNTTGEKDVANIRGDNVVFDHVTAAWSIDENLSIHGVDNVTLYKCIIAEALQYAGHTDGEHSKGSLINGSPSNLSLIGCLYAHNAMRNPRCDRGDIFIANQVNYNWTTGWDEPEPHWFNWVVCTYFANVTFVGNVALQGPESIGEIYLDGYISATNIPSTSYAYIDDNIILDQEGNDLQVYDPDDHVLLDTPPLWPGGFVAIPAHESLYENLRTVGSRPGNRDVHNSRIVHTVAYGNGAVIDSQDEVGGYPDYAATSRSLTVPDGAEARQEWLDSLEDEIAVDTLIDLSRLYSLVGSEASDKFRSHSGFTSSTPHGDYSSGVSITDIVTYPNPVTAKLKVALGNDFAEGAFIQLFDYTGRMVLSLESTGIENSINVENLPPGLYIIRVSWGAKCIIQHIMKK
ncbi:MAG: T9SS type A sorting domain-containing protein [Bacteroidales bacterium]|nr:T9SS type A sorting domain-containing protein [Bacteroidales bacterium]